MAEEEKEKNTEESMANAQIIHHGTESGGGNGGSGNVAEVDGLFILHSEDQQHIGPYVVSELREHFLSGYLTESTPVWSEGKTEGRTEWQPLSAIPGVITGISQQVPLPSTYGDEYEQGQKEVMEAEMLKADSNKLDDIAERPSTPPDGEEEFTDDDGTTNKWDRGLGFLSGSKEAKTKEKEAKERVLQRGGKSRKGGAKRKSRKGGGAKRKSRNGGGKRKNAVSCLKLTLPVPSPDKGGGYKTIFLRISLSVPSPDKGGGYKTLFLKIYRTS